MPLFIIFILVPVIELAVLIKVGGVIGVWWTILLIIITAVVGVNLLRAQGLSTLMRAGEKMQQGDLPVQELAEGFLLALSGAMLLTPGFLTDLSGFVLLLPGIRGQLAQSVIGLLQPGAISNTSRVRRDNDASDSEDVIDGEYRRED